MPTTQLNTGSGGIWTATAPEGVEVTPFNDANGVLGSLNIRINYGEDDLYHGQYHGILSINFDGPVTDPTGTPAIPGFYPGLVVGTAIQVVNDLPGAIDGYTFYLSNESLTTRSPQDVNGVDAHPVDYAHFHNLSPTSLVDETGAANAALTLYSPTFAPGAFGAAGAQSPTPAPDWISAEGKIAPGATERLIGVGQNDLFTLHSMNTPGPEGGSFSLSFYIHKMDDPPPAPLKFEDILLNPDLQKGDLLPPLMPAGPSPELIFPNTASSKGTFLDSGNTLAMVPTTFDNDHVHV